MNSEYLVENASEIPSPALLVYKEKIQRNIEKLISIAGSVERLRPHVKTHKMEELVRMKIAKGIKKFKCATIAEAEMVAQSGGLDILLAYPPVGPAVYRLVRLAVLYPKTNFSTIADDLDAARTLGAAAMSQGCSLGIFLDLDLGMGRTGVVPDGGAIELYKQLCSIPGLRPAGLHGFDGHNHQNDFGERTKAAEDCYARTMWLKNELERRKFPVPTVILGGTPTFPCYAKKPEIELSPGTAVLHDWGYGTAYPDLPFEYAALILSRVISRPSTSTFTIDLGYKGIASDPMGARGEILNQADCEPLFQNEEHWVFKKTRGKVPAIGDILYIVPTHVCPTSALYEEVHAVDGAVWNDMWPVTARNRRLTV
jgi:D-serine deaminase-like pyridoxal phosphate-dependent protein